MSDRKLHELLYVVASLGLFLSLLGCTKCLFWAVAGGFDDLDPEFDNMVKLAGWMSFLSIPGCLLSVASLLLCIALRRSIGSSLWICITISIVGLIVSFIGYGLSSYGVGSG